jgi:hypothetical protein
MLNTSNGLATLVQVPRMKRSKRIAKWLAIALICAIGIWGILAWLGVLDTAPYSVTQSVVLSPDRIAMVGLRSDEAAMIGYEYFVVIGDHVYSPSELRRSFHSSVFSTGLGSFTLEREGPNQLLIRCAANCSITKDIVEIQKFSKGDIAIRYVGFP